MGNLDKKSKLLCTLHSFLSWLLRPPADASGDGSSLLVISSFHGTSGGDINCGHRDGTRKRLRKRREEIATAHDIIDLEGPGKARANGQAFDGRETQHFLRPGEGRER